MALTSLNPHLNQALFSLSAFMTCYVEEKLPPLNKRVVDKDKLLITMVWLIRKVLVGLCFKRTGEIVQAF